MPIVKSPEHPEIYCVLNGQSRSAHLRWGRWTSLYVRRSKRPFQGELVDCFDVARIEVTTHQRSKGNAGRFFDWIEPEARTYGLRIFVESVVNPRFARWLERRGYTPMAADPSSYILM